MPRPTISGVSTWCRGEYISCCSSTFCVQVPQPERYSNLIILGEWGSTLVRFLLRSGSSIVQYLCCSATSFRSPSWLSKPSSRENDFPHLLNRKHDPRWHRYHEYLWSTVKRVSELYMPQSYSETSNQHKIFSLDLAEVFEKLSKESLDRLFLLLTSYWRTSRHFRQLRGFLSIRSLNEVYIINRNLRVAILLHA